jgi:hypothetical protein
MYISTSLYIQYAAVSNGKRKPRRFFLILCRLIIVLTDVISLRTDLLIYGYRYAFKQTCLMVMSHEIVLYIYSFYSGAGVYRFPYTFLLQ